MNPLGKLGEKIRHLTKEEQKYVIDNVQPEGVDISKLTESIQNFKPNELTLDFIHGLFDGDGNLSVYFFTPGAKGPEDTQVSETEDALQCELVNRQGKTKLSVGFSFTIVQDRHNVSLLNEIKSYFNDKGGVYSISKECNIYKAGSRSDLASVILPKMVGGESMTLIKEKKMEELKLPLLKYNKIYYTCKILEHCPPGFKLNGAPYEIMDEIMRLSFYVRQESDDITLENYVEELKKK
jgi:hypothetical protein